MSAAYAPPVPKAGCPFRFETVSGLRSPALEAIARAGLKTGHSTGNGYVAGTALTTISTAEAEGPLASTGYAVSLANRNWPSTRILALTV